MVGLDIKAVGAAQWCWLLLSPSRTSALCFSRPRKLSFSSFVWIRNWIWIYIRVRIVCVGGFLFCHSTRAPRHLPTIESAGLWFNYLMDFQFELFFFVCDPPARPIDNVHAPVSILHQSSSHYRRWLHGAVSFSSCDCWPTLDLAPDISLFSRGSPLWWINKKRFRVSESFIWWCLSSFQLSAAWSNGQPTRRHTVASCAKKREREVPLAFMALSRARKVFFFFHWIISRAVCEWRHRVTDDNNTLISCDKFTRPSQQGHTSSSVVPLFTLSSVE